MSILIMQMKRLRLRGVKQHARAHTAHKCSWLPHCPTGLCSACCWPWPWEIRSVNSVCEVEIEGQNCNIRRGLIYGIRITYMMQLQEQKPGEVPLRRLQNRTSKLDSTVKSSWFNWSGSVLLEIFFRCQRLSLRIVYLASESNWHSRITEMLQDESQELKSEKDPT